MSSEDEFTDELGLVKETMLSREVHNNNLDTIDSEMSSRVERVGDTIDPARMRPNGQPYVDVTSDEYGIEPGVWYSGWDGSTDHTAALQAAMDAAKNDNSQVGAFLPGGEYYVSGPLELDSSRLVNGAGIRSTRIVATEPMDAIFQPKDPSSRSDRWRLAMMELECNGNAESAVSLSNIHKWDLEWLFIRDSVGPGITLHRSWNGRASRVEVGAGSTHAVELGRASHNVSFNDCYLAYTDDTAVVASPGASSWQVTFNRCQFEGDDGTGAFDISDNNLAIVVNNGYFEYEDTHPVINLHNISEFVLNGGSFSGYLSRIANVTETDFRVNDFRPRDFRGGEVKFALDSKPNDLNFSFVDGVLQISPRQIKHFAGSRMLENQIAADEGVMETDSDGDGVVDGWVFDGTNAVMAGTSGFGPAQQIELEQYEYLRYPIDIPTAGDYTIVVIYRIYSPDDGALEPRIEEGSDSSPVRYSSGNNLARLMVGEGESWHLANFNVEFDGSETGIRFERPDSGSNTLTAEIAAAQIYRGEYHVGDVTPYDVNM